VPGKWAQKINPAKEVLSYYHTAFAPSSKIAIFPREFLQNFRVDGPALRGAAFAAAIGLSAMVLLSAADLRLPLEGKLSANAD